MMAPCCTCRCECCCCKGQDCDEEWFKFWEGLIGSDFVIGFLLVFAIALATFAAGLVSVAGDYSNLIEYVYVGAGATFIAGSFIMLYTTFPEQYKSAIGWNLLCQVFCCAKQDADTKGRFFTCLCTSEVVFHVVFIVTVSTTYSSCYHIHTSPPSFCDFLLVIMFLTQTSLFGCRHHRFGERYFTCQRNQRS